MRSFQIRKDRTSDLGTLRTSMNTEQHGATYRCVTSKTRVMGVREGKNWGGQKEICPTFSDCARVVQKNFPEKLSKIVLEGGGGRRSDYEKFLLIDGIFPTKLTEFPTKLTEFVPFIFIIYPPPRPVRP